MVASLSVVAMAAFFRATAAGVKRRYDEMFRPQIHFSPAKNWMNDPNGLIWFEGEYHLFFQHNPYGNQWGHMSWGHAVSRDLLHWTELPVAIPEDARDMIFSGSVVADAGNSAGFGRPGETALVAVYTGHAQDGSRQAQEIAYSLDRGRSWTKYAGNPVLDLGMKEFRDPKVFWFEPAGKWVMAVAKPAERKVAFFQSADLKVWNPGGTFGPAGAVEGVWECPDLFPLPVENRQGETKWVLKVDSSPINPGSGCGGQVFIGSFDGTNFVADSLEPQPLDIGEDYYASTSWSNLPGTRHLTIGWMDNPRYAGETPTTPWRSAMSLPRALSLRTTAGGIRLLQRPVRELQALQTNRQHHGSVKSGQVLVTATEKSGAHRICLTAEPEGRSSFVVVIGSGAADCVRIECDGPGGRLLLSRSGPAAIRSFVSHHAGPLETGGTVVLDLYIDRSSVEVFANDGALTVSELMFPESGSYSVKLEGEGLQADVWDLKSIWS